MKVDFERLKARRDIDPFEMPPIDIRESVAFTAEVTRDHALDSQKVMASSRETGLGRIVATSPTPRLRQLLATLGWSPLDPSSDDHWCLDEPVSFPLGANGLVVDIVTSHYAEGMNLLFAPDDGMFEGRSLPLEPPVGATATETRWFVKRLAERRYISNCVVVRTCPPSVLHYAVEKDIQLLDAARIRGRLAPIKCPSASTVGRWAAEFNVVHADRAGIGREFVNHRPSPAYSSAKG